MGFHSTRSTPHIRTRGQLRMMIGRKNGSRRTRETMMNDMRLRTCYSAYFHTRNVHYNYCRLTHENARLRRQETRLPTFLISEEANYSNSGIRRIYYEGIEKLNCYAAATIYMTKKTTKTSTWYQVSTRSPTRCCIRMKEGRRDLREVQGLIIQQG